MKDYYHILITRKKIDSEYKKYNICSLKEVEGYYKNYIIGKKLIIDNDQIEHCDISNFTIMKSSKKIENKNINFNTDDDIKNCTEEIKQNIELNISETLLKFYYENTGFAWIIIFLIVLSIVNIILPFCIGNTATTTKYPYEFFGIIGDSSGLLGTILSGLAFLLLIYTATLQKNELSLQRKELEATRTELKDQKKEFQIQNQTLKRQQFENTFFKLFSLFMEIKDKVGSTEYVQYNQNNKGETYFSQIFSGWGINVNKKEVDNNFFNNLIKCKYQLSDDGNIINVNGDLKDILKKIGIEFYKFKQIYNLTIAPFTAYYHHLFNTINFVDNSNNVEDTKKQEYINYLIDILSQNEMLVIFCIAYDDNDMKELIEKYHIFKNLLDKTLPDISWKKMYYSDSAFIDE